MSAAIRSLSPPSKILMLLEGQRAVTEFGAFLGSLPLLHLSPKGDGHPVFVIPGLMASDDSTFALRKFLQGRGYAVKGWELGPIEVSVKVFRNVCSIVCVSLATCMAGRSASSGGALAAFLRGNLLR